MPDYFLLLKLILTLNDDTADNTIAGQEQFVMALSDADVAALSEQVEDIASPGGGCWNGASGGWRIGRRD